MTAPKTAGNTAPQIGDGPVMSEEFFLRVNDFIQMANRIEGRYDTHHAQLAMLHGFSRYSAHHYRTTSSAKDDADNREAFADYIGGAVRQLVLTHLEDMVGPAPAPGEASGDAADNASGEASGDAADNASDAAKPTDQAAAAE